MRDNSSGQPMPVLQIKNLIQIISKSESGGCSNLVGSSLIVTKDIGNFFIKVTGELNHYTNNKIKEGNRTKWH